MNFRDRESERKGDEQNVREEVERVSVPPGLGVCVCVCVCVCVSV